MFRKFMIEFHVELGATRFLVEEEKKNEISPSALTMKEWAGDADQGRGKSPKTK